MSDYILRIDAGRGRRRDESLQSDLYRVGTDPSCHITVGCKTPHALTIYRRQGQFHVVNKTRQPIRLGRSAVGPGRCSQWTVGQRVAFEGVSLALRPSTPAAGRKPSLSGRSKDGVEAVRPDSAAGNASSGSRAEQKKSKSKIQYTVITVSLLLVVLMQWVAADAGMDPDGRLTGFALIGADINDTLADAESDIAARRRSAAMLQLIAQFTLAEELEETENAQFARSELIALCTSIRDAADSGDAERQTAARVLSMVR